MPSAPGRRHADNGDRECRTCWLPVPAQYASVLGQSMVAAPYHSGSACPTDQTALSHGSPRPSSICGCNASIRGAYKGPGTAPLSPGESAAESCGDGTIVVGVAQSGRTRHKVAATFPYGPSTRGASHGAGAMSRPIERVFRHARRRPKRPPAPDAPGLPLALPVPVARALPVARPATAARPRPGARRAAAVRQRAPAVERRSIGWLVAGDRSPAFGRSLALACIGAVVWAIGLHLAETPLLRQGTLAPAVAERLPLEGDNAGSRPPRGTCQAPAAPRS